MTALDDPAGPPPHATPSGGIRTPAGREAASFAGSAGAPTEGGGLYRLLVQSVRDYAIFALDSEGRVASWNEGAQRIKGYSADEIVGRHFSTFYPAEDIAAGKPAWELEVAGREGRFEDEGWRLRKDGSLFWANVVITALRNDAGELVGFAKVTRDLTERRAAQERAIADMRRIVEIEVANRAKSEFLTAMSHELRTPLNAIGGYAQLMEQGIGGPVTEQQESYLARIRGSQRHLLGIITDLLNYSRIEAGQVTYDTVAVPMHDVVETVLPLLEPQAAAKGLALEHGPCSGGLVGRADRVKAEQIVLNLLSNAVKFTPAGGRIAVTCGVAGDLVAITVRDTGPGIPADKQAAIFEPFVQLGRTLTSPHEGTGLGLAISRDLARAMDGDITVESVGDAGSTFTLTLPRA
jgi:PAS domain S-box-containing protein